MATPMLNFPRLLKLSAFFIPVLFSSAVSAKASVSDEHIKQAIISESIASYPGTCACPYNSARNGSSCGGRSAWSRGGGYSPICYRSDVTKEMIRQWREDHSGEN